jgi:hypothetical protein
VRTIGIIGLAVVSGCGGGRAIPSARFDPTVVARPADGRSLTTHEAAVRRIATILADLLALPVPEQVTVYVYSSREVFEQGLVQDGQVSPTRAAELSDFAVGVSKRRQLLLNEDGSRRTAREWLRLIAHELTHVAQIELAQGEGRAEQWLAEGMAEWSAFTVLEHLGLDTLARRRDVAVAGIRPHAPFGAPRLDLESLGSPRGFTVRHLREGSLAIYQLAFLMTDYLVQRHGFSRVVEYFSSLAQGRDRRRQFERAFGQTLEEFESEIVTHLNRIVG